MKITEILPNILLVTTKQQFDLNDTFMRPQEYYESDIEGIYNSVFTFGQFKKAYSKKYGNGEFTYYTDWVGFNIQGVILAEFFTRFTKLRKPEKTLYSKLSKLIDMAKLNEYSVIGVVENSKDDTTLPHEIAHAIFHLNKKYKAAVLKVVDEMEKEHPEIYKYCKDTLIDMGYREDIVKDEINAYLATDSLEYNARFFNAPYSTLKPYHEKLTKIYKDFT